MQILSTVVTGVAIFFTAVMWRDDTPSQIIDSARTLLGTEREKEGVVQLESAVTVLDEKIKQEPKRDDLQFELGRAHYYLGHAEAAVSAFNIAIQLNPKKAEAYFLRGVLQWRTDKLESGIASLDQARKLDLKNAEYWSEWGEALLENGEKSKARSALEESLQLDPRRSAALLALGAIDYEEGKLEASLEKCLRVIAIDSSSTLAHYNAGQTLQTLGKHDKALSHFQSVVKLDPDDGRAAAKIVQCHQALRQLKERDASREKVFEIFKKGAMEREFYCRDQFRVLDKAVLALEYFELHGDGAIRYSFHVQQDGKPNAIYRISLGSYDSTNELAHARGVVSKEQRYFHLDRYFPTKKHETFAFFKGEPTYDDVRERVIAIIEGKSEPISSMTPTSQSSIIEENGNDD